MSIYLQASICNAGCKVEICIAGTLDKKIIICYTSGMIS